VILFDEKNGDPEILDLLLPLNIKPNVQTWRGFWWNDNFADWKNRLNEYCTGDYIFQIDADEMISEYMIKNLHEIIELNPEIDLFYLPRINTVEGITDEHINEWKWKLNDKGWINFPDYQGRVYRQKMTWYGKVHERIIGGSKYSILPMDEENYCIQHHKTIKKQEKQNNFYKTI
jgi:glycosyltransferase involved in cell wall biosynthesis